jgi:hypothetical protein
MIAESLRLGCSNMMQVKNVYDAEHNVTDDRSKHRASVTADRIGNDGMHAESPWCGESKVDPRETFQQCKMLGITTQLLPKRA